MKYGRIFSYLNHEDAKNLIGKEVAFCDRPSYVCDYDGGKPFSIPGKCLKYFEERKK